MASPAAIEGSTCFFSSSDAASMIGTVASLFTAGINEEDAQTRATSSITMQAATASAPSPPYSSGMCTAWKPDRVNAACASVG